MEESFRTDLRSPADLYFGNLLPTLKVRAEETRVAKDSTVVDRRRRVYAVNEYGGVVGDLSDVVAVPANIGGACWWCCHDFDTTRFFVPTHYVGGTYHVRGNFCSANCADAYRLREMRALHGGIFRLYLKEVHGIPMTQSVRPALPRETLQLFGGPLTIRDFRLKSVTSKVELYRPPLYVEIDRILETEEVPSRFHAIAEPQMLRRRPRRDIEFRNPIRLYRTIEKESNLTPLENFGFGFQTTPAVRHEVTRDPDRTMRTRRTGPPSTPSSVSARASASSHPPP